MTGQDRHVIAERQELFLDAADQQFMVAVRKIRAADRTLEQGVADQREARRRVHEHQMAGRVAGNVQHTKRQIADADRLAFDQPARRRDIAHVGDVETLPLRFEVLQQESVLLVRPFDREIQRLGELRRTARMVDVNTGEILASVTGHGESQRNGLTSSGSGFSGWKGGGGQLDMGSTNFSQSILGQAVKQSVNDTAKGLEQHAGSLPVNAPAPPAPIDGLVADASGGEIIINVGSSAGVKVGDKLVVTRVLRTVKDPASGKVLRTIDSPVGMLTVTSVDSGSAVGKFDGTGAPKVGDAVKRP